MPPFKPPKPKRLLIHLIFAKARNGVIGHNNAIPWHLPEDLAHFKRTTLGNSVVMGRKTWDSLPPEFRPLPGRLNLVLTRQPGWAAAGAIPVASLPAVSQHVPVGSDVWVIGGAELYAQALPVAATVTVTEIDADFPGDAHAPELGPEWVEASRVTHHSKTGLGYDLVQYLRKVPLHLSQR